MKIKFTNDAKRAVNIAQMPAVEKVKKYCEDYTNGDLQDYAIAAAWVAGCTDRAWVEILKVDAEIAKNGRVWDAIDEGTEDIDVWLNIYAFDSYTGFYEIGIYLTDAWQISEDNYDEIKSHMFINKYTLE